MARNGSLLPIVLLGGAGYLLLTTSGRALLLRQGIRLPGALQGLPAINPAGVTQAPVYAATQPVFGAAAPAAGTPSSLTAPGAPAWQAFKDSGSGQVWVRNPATGEWRYISSPALYSKYGIAADEHNLAYGIPAAWGWPGADQAGRYAAT